MKKLLIAAALLTSVSAHADSYKACIAIKNLCNETVKLFTETLSSDRVEGLYQCQVLKADCNNLFSQITDTIDGKDK